MNLYRSDKARFILGLILILIIYSLYYIYFLEHKNTLLISRKVKHIITFSTTVFVYFVGTFHLGKLKDEWMSSLWHIIHITGLCIITTLGLFDWLIAEISLSLRQFVLSVQEFLISPVLYVAMGLLNKSLKKGSEA